MIKPALLCSALIMTASYPFYFDTNMSLLQNYGYYNINSSTKTMTVAEFKETVSRAQHLNTAIDIIVEQRAELSQRQAELESLRFSHDRLFYELEDKQSALIDVKDALVTLNAKFSDMAFAFDIEDSPPIRLADTINHGKVEATTKLMLSHSIPLGPVLPEGNAVSSMFGPRSINHPRASQFHKGIDFVANVGTPIFAPADAVVEAIRPDGKGLGSGNFIRLNHGLGFTTSYSHMDSFAVSQHDVVSKGDIIGYTGNTGISSAPHLHYEIVFLGRKLDPYPFVNFDTPESAKALKEMAFIPWNSLLDNAKELSIRTALVLR